MLYTEPFPTIDAFADRLETEFPQRRVPPASRKAAALELERDLARMVPVRDVHLLLRLLREAGLRLALVSNLARTYLPVIQRYAIDTLVDVAVYSFAETSALGAVQQ